MQYNEAYHSILKPLIILYTQLQVSRSSVRDQWTYTLWLLIPFSSAFSMENCENNEQSSKKNKIPFMNRSFHIFSPSHSHRFTWKWFVYHLKFSCRMMIMTMVDGRHLKANTRKKRGDIYWNVEMYCRVLRAIFCGFIVNK